MSSEKAFFLLKKKFKGERDGFVGPIFDEEIEEVKKEEFTDEDVDILDEELFKTLYFENYLEDFVENWDSYISAKLIGLDIDHHFIGITDGEEEHTILAIEDFGSIQKNDDQLTLIINLDAIPHLVALITNELTKYCNNILEVEINQPLYINNKGGMITNEEAYNQFNLEKLYIINEN